MLWYIVSNGLYIVLPAIYIDVNISKVELFLESCRFLSYIYVQGVSVCRPTFHSWIPRNRFESKNPQVKGQGNSTLYYTIMIHFHVTFGWGPYLDGGLHEDRRGIIHAFGAEMQHRRVTLLGRAC